MSNKKTFRFPRDTLGGSAKTASTTSRKTNRDQQQHNQKVSPKYHETKMKQSTGVNINITLNTMQTQSPASQTQMSKGPKDEQHQRPHNYKPHNRTSQNYNQGAKSFTQGTKPSNEGRQRTPNYGQNTNTPNQGFNPQGNQSDFINITLNSMQKQRPASQTQMLKEPKDQQHQRPHNYKPQHQTSQNYNQGAKSSTQGTKPSNEGHQRTPNYGQNTNKPNQGFNPQGSHSDFGGRSNNSGQKNSSEKNGGDKVVIIKKTVIIKKN